MNYSVVKKAILNYLVKNQKLTGYEFIKYCREIGFNISPGTVYPALKKLLEKNIVIYKISGRKKVYELTELGKKYYSKIETENKNETNKIRMVIECECTGLPEKYKEKIAKFIQKLPKTNWENLESVKRIIEDFKECEIHLNEYYKKLEERS